MLSRVGMYRHLMRRSRVVSSLTATVKGSEGGNKERRWWKEERRRDRTWARFATPTLAFGLFGAFPFGGGGGDRDPFEDLDRIFQEFFNQPFQGGGFHESRGFTWNPKDGYREWSSSSPSSPSDTFRSSPSDPFRANTLGPVDEDNIFHAAALNKAEAVRWLKADVEKAHDFGWRPLHVAAVHGHVQAIQALLDCGADVNAADEFSTPMKIAEEDGLDPRSVLVDRQRHFGVGLPANYDFTGTTPLHYAVLSSSAEAVEALLSAGADPLRKNKDGQTPLHFARSVQAANLVPILTQAVKQALENKKKLDAEERRKFPLQQRLKKRLVGQEAAIHTVSSAIRRKENGWYDDDHPLVMLFLGSSGVGKTELAKQVAKYLHRDDPRAFIRIDMSEFQQKHEVSKFIGSPPGYVGHEEGGQLTKQLREYPEAVVLFDEVEKAHPDILTILLQLFDEGRLTDGKGETIECKSAIFVMTSNLAASGIAERAKNLEERKASKDSEEEEVMSREFKESVVQPILRRALRRDEFLGRINEMVYFLPFTPTQLRELVLAELELWVERAWNRHSIRLEWDEAVIASLAGGYNHRYGARSIKHTVESRVVNLMATAHENEVIQPHCTVRLQLKDDQIVLDIKLGTSSFLSSLPSKIVNKFSSKV